MRAQDWMDTMNARMCICVSTVYGQTITAKDASATPPAYARVLLHARAVAIAACECAGRNRAAERATLRFFFRKCSTWNFAVKETLATHHRRNGPKNPSRGKRGFSGSAEHWRAREHALARYECITDQPPPFKRHKCRNAHSQ